MNVLSGMNRFLESKATAGTVFAVTGLSKLASDYKAAPQDKKNFTLAHNSIVLGTSALGVVAYNIASKKVIGSKHATKALSTIKAGLKNKLQEKHYSKPAIIALSNIAEVSKRCIDNTLMLGTGILGAIGADYGIHAIRLDKKLKPKPITTTEEESFNKIYDTKNKIINSFKESSINKNLENTVGTEIKSNMYSRIFDFPAMKMFATSMVGIQGFEVIEEKTLKSRMKHATKCLIANSIVPVFFLSTASALTKNMNSVLRLPVTFATMIFGTMYTNRFIDKHQYTHKTNSSNKNMIA